MNWIIIVLVWLIAPFAELGIIIGLCVKNDRYKRQIAELTWQKDRFHMRQRAMGNLREQETSQNQTDLQEQTDGQRQTKPPAQAAPQELPKDQKSNTGSDITESHGFGQRILKGTGNNLGTLALVLGVVFIVLAGLIFATTTWHVLADLYKAVLVLACAGVFFGASFLAKKVFDIRRTGNAFYILGSVFLFLTVLAGAYFRLLGPEFILEGKNRWKVLWVGSLVLEGAFFAGLKQFDDRIYTQASLWGMSVSMFFLVKSCSMDLGGFVSVMMIYSGVLILIREFSKGRTEREGGSGFWEILERELGTFVPVHFWVFGIPTFLRGFFAIAKMLTDGWMGVNRTVLCEDFLFAFTVPGMLALVVLWGGIYILARGKDREVYDPLLDLAAAETILFGTGLVSEDFACRMAMGNLLFLLRKGIWFWRTGKRKSVKQEEFHELFWDIAGCVLLIGTIFNFYTARTVTMGTLILCLAAFAGYYVCFYFGPWQWTHILASAALLPLPPAAVSRLPVSFDHMGIAVFAVLVISGGVARRFYPILKPDDRVLGGWRADWFQILGIFEVFLIASLGNHWWRFAGTLFAALYVLQYGAVPSLKKGALFLSAFFLALAFWDQPLVRWPMFLELEFSLLPAVWIAWTAGKIWNRTSWIRPVQTLGYVICLLILCADAVGYGRVEDSLVLEGICLSIFVWALIKGYSLWVKISGAVILFIVLFMTRDFWLSLSWWVYLLAAGIGLIVFAGILEKRRR